MGRNIHVRDGLEVYSADEVRGIEAASTGQLTRDLNRAQVWMASKDFEKAAKILQPSKP